MPLSYVRERLIFQDGQLVLKDQLGDYQNRGTALDKFSMLDFLLRTYDSKEDRNDEESSDMQSGWQRRGPNYSPRIQYVSNHRPGHVRILRRSQNEVLPHFIGRWFPRSDKPEIRPLYCAAMLMLLSPWRTLEDLLPNNVMFEEAFQNFQQQASPRVNRILDNIQFYYISRDLAQKRQQNDNSQRHGLVHVVAENDGVESQSELQWDQLLVCGLLSFVKESELLTIIIRHFRRRYIPIVQMHAHSNNFSMLRMLWTPHTMLVYSSMKLSRLIQEKIISGRQASVILPGLRSGHHKYETIQS